MYRNTFFPSNHNIDKSLRGLCFWALDLLIDIFYKNLSIKGSEAQKQRLHELLWMLRFDEKSVSNKHSLFSYVQSENEFPHSNKQWDDDGIHPKNVAFVATAFV